MQCGGAERKTKPKTFETELINKFKQTRNKNKVFALADFNPDIADNRKRICSIDKEVAGTIPFQ